MAEKLKKLMELFDNVGNWLARRKEGFAVLISAIALGLTLYQGRQTSHIQEKQTDLAQTQTRLASRQTDFGASQSLMNVLTMVSNASADLGGWATVAARSSPSPADKAGQIDVVSRVSSDQAIKDYFREKAHLDKNGAVVIPYEDKGRGGMPFG